MTWEPVARMLQVNVVGALATLVTAMPLMVARGRGTLSAVSSLAAMRGLPSSAVYSASKAAVSTFLEAIRIELAATGVQVVDVLPGFVDTPMTQKRRGQMPFLMDVGAAAERIVAGLERGEPVVAFPWPHATAMRVASSMPDRLWGMLAGRLAITSRR